MVSFGIFDGFSSMGYRIEWLNELVVFEFFGTATDEDLICGNDEICNSPYLAEIRAQLVLFCRSTEVQFTPKAMMHVAHQDEAVSAHYPNVQIAVVTDDPLAYGMTRMYQLTGTQSLWETQIFSTIEEASSWIHLPKVYDLPPLDEPF